MTSGQQCGLCLSCGAPFCPNAGEVDLLRHRGNTSVLFLNMEFSDDRELRRRFRVPKYSDVRHASHIFHDSHHQGAIFYMCNRHTGDNDVTWQGQQVVSAGMNGPFPYFQTPTSAKAKGPMAATWNRPPAAERLDLAPLMDAVIKAANGSWVRSMAQVLDERHAICRACNMIMTQENNSEYHLGSHNMRAENTGFIIRGSPVMQVSCRDRGKSDKEAFGHWRQSVPGHTSQHPAGNQTDDLSPMVAYYLHLCLPYGAPFSARVITPGMEKPARDLYIELSWIILMIASVAISRDLGTRYKPRGQRSHGPQQHSGVLDLYVSYFLFRLMRFEYGEQVNRQGLDFIQWHQKYFWDALNCKGLFPSRDGTSLLGAMVYSNVVQPSRDLIAEIGAGLIRLYERDLDPLIRFVTNERVGLPLEVTQFFLPLPAMRELKTRSTQKVLEDDFQSALDCFGADALLFRTIDLCKDCPIAFRRQLEDFRRNWQWLEMQNIRRSNKEFTMRSAYTHYMLCRMLVSPDSLTSDVSKSLESLRRGDLCSPWTSVIPLDSMGAFQIE